MVDEITTILTNLGLPSNEPLVAIVLLVLAIIGCIVVVVAIRKVLEVTSVAYPDARIRARKGRLFDEKQMSEILETDTLEELENYLSGFPEYADFISKYPIEKALDSQLASNYETLASVAPDELKATFRALNKKWDIHNIKSLITATEFGLGAEKSVDLLVPYGEYYENIESLTSAKNITDIVAGLEGTPYSSILEDALPEYDSKKTVLPLESALDKYYLEELLRTSATPDEDNSRILRSFIGSQVDITNIKIILRSKADGLAYNEISPYIISNGYQIQDWKLKELMESEDVATVIGSLEGTDYAPTLTSALNLYNETGSISVLESSLDEYLMKTAKNLSLKQPFGVGPMIGFLDGKEREIKNLKMIVRAKREAQFSNSAIKEMLL